MEITIISQLYLLCIYIITGIIIGIIFDIFRILRKTFSTSDFITYIEDILFWILTGIILIFVSFNISYGQIRLYNIFGLLFGLILYMLYFSKLFIKINVKILNFIKNVTIKIINILIFPIKLIIKALKKVFTPITFFVINVKKKALKNKKQINITKNIKKNKHKKGF